MLPFYLRCHFSLPNFPVAQFSAAHFSGCRFFRGLFRFRYFRHFFVALFSYHVNFRCRIFLLPNFPVAISSVAVFFCCPFPLLLFHILNLCCPVFLPSHFSLPIFPIAQFSGSHFFRCRFFSCPFSVAVFAVNRQDYYWQDASRGHSAIAELLVKYITGRFTHAMFVDTAIWISLTHCNMSRRKFPCQKRSIRFDRTLTCDRQRYSRHRHRTIASTRARALRG